jgi:hypothetical protein
MGDPNEFLKKIFDDSNINSLKQFELEITNQCQTCKGIEKTNQYILNIYSNGVTITELIKNTLIFENYCKICGPFSKTTKTIKQSDVVIFHLIPNTESKDFILEPSIIING